MQRKQSVWDSYHHKKLSEYPQGTMFDTLEESAKDRQNNIALEYYGSRIKYRDFMCEIRMFAGKLAELGVKSDDYVTIISPNVPQAVIAIYAVNYLGAVSNLLHPLLPAADMQNAIDNVKSRVIIILDKVFPKLQNNAWENRKIPQYILLQAEDKLSIPAKMIYRLKNKDAKYKNDELKILYWHDLMLEKQNSATPERSTKGFDDTAVILYSGGTLGKPKGIMLTNGNFNALAVQLSETYYEDSVVGSRSLALMPIFHGYGLGVCIHGMLYSGCHVFLLPVYDMKECTKLIFRKKINFLFGVPALYEAISRSEEIEKKNLKFLKLIVSAGDRNPPELLNNLNRQLKKGGSGTEVREAYGLTESTSGCCMNPFFAMRNGSLGLPFPDMEMRIAGLESGETVPAGEIGEICISGPTVMKAYLGMQKETEDVLVKDSHGEIWLHTGDLGYRDSNGYYFFVQRMKNMIVTAGYNVYPSQIESLIRKNKSVVDCCVIGREDPVLGQKPVAFVVLKKTDGDKDNVRMQLLRSFEEELPNYSVPHAIYFLDALPKTGYGKTDTVKLKELLF